MDTLLLVLAGLTEI